MIESPSHFKDRSGFREGGILLQLKISSTNRTCMSCTLIKRRENVLIKLVTYLSSASDTVGMPRLLIFGLSNAQIYKLYFISFLRSTLIFLDLYRSGRY